MADNLAGRMENRGMPDLADDGHCFVCGPKNPAGLKLAFAFDGKTMRTHFVPRKEHQGYANIVHGGIVATLLDEIMVKLAIAMGMPAVTAHMNIRLKQALQVGQEVTVEAQITREAKKLIEAYAKVITGEGVIAADARGKLVKVKTEAL